MRRPELAGPVQLPVVHVDGDDLLRPDQARPGDRRIAHAAAADDRHGVVAVDGAGVNRSPDAGHHTATQQTGRRGVSGGVHLRALPLVYQRLVGERADAQCGGQRGAVGQRHRLLGVERVEAQVRAAALARPALPAHGAPVQHHEVTRLDVRHAGADRFDSAGRLMAQQERELVVDAAVAVGQIGVAHPARGDVDDDLTGSRIGDDDVHHLDRF